MSEQFKAIESQDELDKIVTSRLARQKESYEEKLAELDQLRSRNSELENENVTLQKTMDENSKKYATYEQDVEALNSKIAEYEVSSLRTKIALNHGLPLDLADRLKGNDEESLTADAERLSGLVQVSGPVQPLRNPEPQVTDDKTSAYKKLIEGLSPEGE